jgi:hypothetical protein
MGLILLWLLGIPIPILIIIALLAHHKLGGWRCTHSEQVSADGNVKQKGAAKPEPFLLGAGHSTAFVTWFFRF